jgi:ABC-type Fe3+-hydroxamate transport system substrate-binding protein
VGGTKDPDIEAIAKLEPTHIILNSEENTPEHIAQCEVLAKTLVTFPKGPTDVAPMLGDMGDFLGCPEKFHRLKMDIADKLTAIRGLPASGPRYAYLIWKNPYMAAGLDTYITRCLDLIGWKNVATEEQGRYPAFKGPHEILSAKPEVILLATEPFPFRKRDVHMLTKELQNHQIQILKVDGRLTQWYGDLTLLMLQQAVVAKPGGFPGFISPF